MWPSGGLARVARPLAGRCSTFGGGRSDLGDLVTGGGRPRGCTGRRDARVREAVRLRVPGQTHACDAAVLVRRHLAEFLGRCEERVGPLPAFVKEELEGFAGCGDFELGFVRTCCRSCGDELRVPFSCKSRGCCPSCMGRRMAEGAALLVDHVLPAVGYRQWVLSFPGPLAVRL